MIKDRSHHPIVVVGAGPGGSWAARTAAEKGVPVLLLEKRKVIGYPVRCAEGMTKSMFAEIGITPKEEWISNTITGARIISPSGHAVLVDSSHKNEICGWVLNREVFDSELAIMAAQSGATVHAGTGVVSIKKRADGWELSLIHTGKRISITADVIIAADGFESQVGRWAGLETLVPFKDMMTCLEYTLEGVKGDHRTMDFFFDHNFCPGGYAWVFWKGPKKANVGMGISGARLGNRGTVQKHLESFISSKPDLACGERVRVIAGGIPTSKPLKCTVGHRILLIGDAARVTDPLHGGGITNAMITGDIAGRCAAQFIQNGKDDAYLKRYDKEWRMRLERSLYLHYMIKEYIGNLNNDQIDIIIEALSHAKLDSLEPSTLIKHVEIIYPQIADKIPQLV